MTIRCRLFGHRYVEVQDYSQCGPGYYMAIRACRRCDLEENLCCVRDDGKWAAIQLESGD